MREYLRFDKIENHYLRRTLLIPIYPILFVVMCGVYSLTVLREIVSDAAREFRGIWREPNRY